MIMKPYQIVFLNLLTAALTFALALYLVRSANQTSNENWQSIKFPSKKLEKILTDNNFDKFEISPYLSAISQDGSKIMIDLSKDPSVSDEQVELSANDEQIETGISKRIDRHLLALVADIPCERIEDIYIHPGITPPGNTCNKFGVYGGFSINGKYITKHCHCYDPKY